jgi:RNA polymerase sigma-70 factor (ECF subfamily)
VAPAPDQLDVSDEALMMAHTAGSNDAFRELYRRYAQALLRLMLRAHRSKEEARDLVQQTFLQLHRARNDYDPNRCFRSWLYTIAINVNRGALRKQRHAPTVWNAALEAAEPVAESPAHEQLQIARAVRTAIAALPPLQREVIELHWFDGLSFGEIGECLGVPLNTAKVRAHRGYESLRARLRHLKS